MQCVVRWRCGVLYDRGAVEVSGRDGGVWGIVGMGRNVLCGGNGVYCSSGVRCIVW